jgi:hypothetical protein
MKINGVSLIPAASPIPMPFPFDAVRQGEIADDQGQQHDVDLPEGQCHRNRFEPEAHRGDRKRRRRPGQAGGLPGESQGKVRHHRQQPDREHGQPDLPGRERRTAPRGEQERGERRVDERQLRRAELQRVEHRRLVPHRNAAIPVDGRVDLRPVVLRGRVDEQGITGHGQQEQCDRGHEPGGWPYWSHRSVFQP